MSRPFPDGVAAHAAGAVDLVVHPSGDAVFTAGADGELKIFSAKLSDPTATVRQHEGAINQLAISADGSRLATCGADKKVFVYDATPQDVEMTALAHRFTSSALAVAFNADATKLAAAGDAHDIKLLTLQGEPKVSSIHGHVSGVKLLSYDPLGEYLASGDCRGTVRVWDVILKPRPELPPRLSPTAVAFEMMSRQGTLTKSTPEDVAMRSRGAWHPSGAFLALPGASAVTLLARDATGWPAHAGVTLCTGHGHGRNATGLEVPIDSLSWSPSGRYLASAGLQDGRVCVWDVAAALTGAGAAALVTTFQAARTPTGYPAVTALQWAPTANRLYCAASTGTVYALDSAVPGDLPSPCGAAEDLAAVAAEHPQLAKQQTAAAAAAAATGAAGATPGRPGIKAAGAAATPVAAVIVAPVGTPGKPHQPEVPTLSQPTTAHTAAVEPAEAKEASAVQSPVRSRSFAAAAAAAPQTPPRRSPAPAATSPAQAAAAQTYTENDHDDTDAGAHAATPRVTPVRSRIPAAAAAAGAAAPSTTAVESSTSRISRLMTADDDEDDNDNGDDRSRRRGGAGTSRVSIGADEDDTYHADSGDGHHDADDDDGLAVTGSRGMHDGDNDDDDDGDGTGSSRGGGGRYYSAEDDAARDEAAAALAEMRRLMGARQPAFQPGAAPAAPPRVNTAILCWSHGGYATQHRSSLREGAVTIHFGDQSEGRRSMTVADPHGFALGTLDAEGALFATGPRDANGNPVAPPALVSAGTEGSKKARKAAAAAAKRAVRGSLVCYRAFRPWAPVGDWEAELPPGEAAQSIAVGPTWAAVATSSHVHFFTFSGLRSFVMALPGPLVAITGRDLRLALAYHAPGLPAAGEQALRVQILDLSDVPVCPRAVSDGVLPVTAGSTLIWLGFSADGVLYTHDSADTTRVLATALGHVWAPVHVPAPGSGVFHWPVFVQGASVLAYTCHGARHHPLHELESAPAYDALPLRLPFAAPGARIQPDEASLEALVRARLLQRERAAASSAVAPTGTHAGAAALSAADAQLRRGDAAVAALIRASVDGGNLTRALDLAAWLSTADALDRAAEAVNISRKAPQLVTRLNELLAARQAAAQPLRAVSTSGSAPAYSSATALPRTPSAGSAAGVLKAASVDRRTNLEMAEELFGSYDEPISGGGSKAPQRLSSSAAAAAAAAAGGGAPVSPARAKRPEAGGSAGSTPGSQVKKARGANPFAIQK